MRVFTYLDPKNEFRVVESSDTEMYAFKDRLYQAMHDYFQTTGKSATHLILGTREQAQFDGMIYLMAAAGVLGIDFTAPVDNEEKFCGLPILKSCLSSILIAVRDK